MEKKETFALKVRISKPPCPASRQVSFRHGRNLLVRQAQLALATPNPNHPQQISIMPIDDAKRRMDQLPKVRSLEFRHHPPHVRVVRKALDALEDLTYKPQTHLWRTILSVPGQDVPQVGQCGFRYSNIHR